MTVQPEGSFREALGQVTSFLRAVAENSTRCCRCDPQPTSTPSPEGQIGLLLSLEGVEQFGLEISPAELFHALGRAAPAAPLAVDGDTSRLVA